MLSHDAQERLVKDHQKDLLSLAHPKDTRRRHHDEQAMGHGDRDDASQPAKAGEKKKEPREALKLAADGVVCWELCSLPDGTQLLPGHVHSEADDGAGVHGETG